MMSFMCNTFTISANVPWSHNNPEIILNKKKLANSFAVSFLLFVFDSNTNNLFVTYANSTAHIHARALLITSSIPNNLVKARYTTKLTKVVNPPKNR